MYPKRSAAEDQKQPRQESKRGVSWRRKNKKTAVLYVKAFELLVKKKGEESRFAPSAWTIGISNRLDSTDVGVPRQS